MSPPQAQPRRSSIIERLSILDVYEYCKYDYNAGKGYKARTNHLPNGDYIARCPVVGHEDKNPSCRLSTKSNFWSCYACNRGGKKRLEGRVDEGSMLGLVVLSGNARNVREAAEFLERKSGIVLDNLIDQPPTKRHHLGDGKPSRLKNERLTASHVYRDVDGSLLYQARRYDGLDEDDQHDKRFIGRRPAKAGESYLRWHTDKETGARTKVRKVATGGEWLYDLDGVKLVPYNLPEVIAACSAGRVLIDVEGEKLADQLGRLGFTATTNYGGWPHDHPDEWAPYFQGVKIVFISVDSDRWGRLRGLSRKAFYEKHTDAQVIIVDYFPERTNGDDLEQWIVSIGADADAIKRLGIRNADGSFVAARGELDLNALSRAIKDNFTGRLHADKELQQAIASRKPVAA